MRLLLKLFGAVIGLIALYTFRDTNTFKVNSVFLETEKIPDDGRLRILQITDMHNKRGWRLHRRLLNQVKDLSPNMIVLTGDLIDRRTRDFRKIFTFIELLAGSGIPVYFVTGNHEWGNKKGKMFIEGLKQRKVNVLENEQEKLFPERMKITLVGIHDTSTQHEDVQNAFNHVREDTYTILLSHSPYVIKTYPDLPADLVLSGHTHGGQVRLPIIGAVISPGGGVFPELDKGIFQWGEEKHIYVDSGLGTSMIPVRFLNQSQISLIQINGKSNKKKNRDN